MGDLVRFCKKNGVNSNHYEGQLSMMRFFRKYERYFFILITIVIVISFSFFGTYRTLQRHTYVDTTAFVAVNGAEVGRLELEEMALFIGTDNEDKLLLGGAWGPNFLNDGVIKKDILETGMAPLLVAPFLGDLKADLQTRFQKEKNYKPYVHPQAKYLSAVNVWTMIAPDIVSELTALQQKTDPATPEAFDVRARLFLAEKRFPAPALQYVLKSQEKQNSAVPADPALKRTDVSLFGYHTLSDWFGPKFVRLVAQFIINSAIIAEQKGYRVSENEALADLYRNAEVSYQQNAYNPRLGVVDVDQYVQEQLRRMGNMDQSQAVNIWRQVMLFRRLFHDVGYSVLLDPFTVSQVQQYAKMTVEGDLYKLPDDLRLGSFAGLQKFETYLSAVSDRPTEGKALLDLPTTFKSVDAVSKETPELVQKRYLLDIASVNKKTLQARVGVKETWEWEAKEKNWGLLKKQFPELGVKPGATEQERFNALDALDTKTRARVDAFARQEIAKENPGWLQEAFAEAQRQTIPVGIRLKGETPSFPGLKDPEKLIGLLDRYPDSEKELQQYAPDGDAVYSIKVVEKSTTPDVLTFAEADKEGVLTKLVEKRLETYYIKMREENPKEFQNSDGSWKAVYLVRDKVAASLFNNILNQIKSDYASAMGSAGAPSPMIGDFAASLRFYAYMRGLQDTFKKNPEAIQNYLRTTAETPAKDKLPPLQPLVEQWKLVKSDYKAERAMKGLPIDKEVIFALKEGAWSPVQTRANGDLAFFQMKKTYDGQDLAGLQERVLDTQKLVSYDAMKTLTERLMGEMVQKNALSLGYMAQQQQEAE